ncbi:MAG: arginine--tRNA ligase [Fibrobacteres bacterium]|nr:arginine--tRNA ligase [Fibrobacterota bacterium]
MKTYKEEIAELLAPLTGLPAQDIVHAITLPQHLGQGDFAFPCFPLAKKLRKAPPAIAIELAGQIKPTASIVKVEALNGYLNFFVDAAEFARRTLGPIAEEGAAYGTSRRGDGETVCIDFSSPNMGKELVFHHLRGTMIGNSLSKLYARAGYRVVRINHLGDWGTSYGKLIVMFLREGLHESDLAGMTIERLNALYTAFAKAAEADPSMEDQARAAFQKLESGDAMYRRLWQSFKDITLAELRRIYGFLEVGFDSYIGEAYFIDHMPKTLDLLAAKGLVQRSQGADIVDLSAHNLPPALLRKSDGATLYVTRDIAAAIYRSETYGFSKCLYVVDNGQSLHFQQLIKVLELAGYPWAKGMEHVPFGLVLIKSEEGGWEKGKTRSGQASLLKDVIEAAQEKILGIIKEKNPDAEGKEELALRIGVGALVFSELKNRRLNDIRFEWDQALSFEGDSGPYVQNAHVRLCSILRKSIERSGVASDERAGLKGPAENGTDGLDFTRYPEPQAQALIRALSLLPDKIRVALDANDPCPMAQYALEIAETSHSFIHSCRVLGSPEEKERLFLIDCARIVLGSTLDLIGVPPIEYM